MTNIQQSKAGLFSINLLKSFSKYNDIFSTTELTNWINSRSLNRWCTVTEVRKQLKALQAQKKVEYYESLRLWRLI